MVDFNFTFLVEIRAVMSMGLMLWATFRHCLAKYEHDCKTKIGKQLLHKHGLQAIPST